MTTFERRQKYLLGRFNPPKKYNNHKRPPLRYYMGSRWMPVTEWGTKLIER